MKGISGLGALDFSRVGFLKGGVWGIFMGFGVLWGAEVFRLRDGR